MRRFLDRLARQTAVYWESTGNDGFGGSTFAAPIEIQVRWEEGNEYNPSKDSENAQPVTSQTKKIIYKEALTKNSYLYLGSLTDIGSEPNPLNVTGTFKILEVNKVPTIKGDVINYEHSL